MGEGGDNAGARPLPPTRKSRTGCNQKPGEELLRPAAICEISGSQISGRGNCCKRRRRQRGRELPRNLDEIAEGKRTRAHMSGCDVLARAGSIVLAESQSLTPTL